MFEDRTAQITIEQDKDKKFVWTDVPSKNKPDVSILLARNLMVWGSAAISVACIFGLIQLIF